MIITNYFNFIVEKYKTLLSLCRIVNRGQQLIRIFSKENVLMRNVSRGLA
jgi:hypothetical protein